MTTTVVLLVLWLLDMVTMPFLYGPEKRAAVGQKIRISGPCEVMMNKSRNMLIQWTAHATVTKIPEERTHVI